FFDGLGATVLLPPPRSRFRRISLWPPPCCSRLALSRRWLGISPGTATQRRGYNISEVMVRIGNCCCSRLALSRRDLLSRLARRHSAVATTPAKRWLV